MTTHEVKHAIIKRATHVPCGATFTDPFTLDVLNEMDVACPKCQEECAVVDCNVCKAPYGVMVWEHRDGTLWETESNGDEVIRHQRVFTHCVIYKSWVNGPEWWVRPEPNTGDLDDDHTVGFDHYWQARAALGGVAQIITEIAPGGPDSIVWRDRNNPIYQLTPPEEVKAAPADPITPLPPESNPVAARRELDALGRTLALQHLGSEFEDGDAPHTQVWLDWALQIRQWGFTWAEALTIARVWYFG